MFRLYYYLVLVMLYAPLSLAGQGLVDMCVAKGDGHWMLIAKPSMDFEGIFSNLQLTLRLTGPHTKILAIEQSEEVADMIPLQFAGESWQFQGDVYQKIVGFGVHTLEENGWVWKGDSSYALLKIYSSDMDTEIGISLTKDTELKQGEYYSELNSYDRTGDIFYTCLAHVAMVSVGKELTDIGTVYPNPSTGMVMVSGPYDGPGIIQLLDLSGHVLLEKHLIFDPHAPHALNLGAYPQGYYTLVCIQNGHRINHPFIKN